MDRFVQSDNRIAKNYAVPLGNLSMITLSGMFSFVT